MLHIGERKKNVLWRLPVEWSHREVIILTLSDSELSFKISEVIELMASVELFVVLSMAAFNLSVVLGCVWFYQLMLDSKLL